ncbi:MAG: hypothetical protein ACREF1_15010 [Acetobacteraceae bacterium]
MRRIAARLAASLALAVLFAPQLSPSVHAQAAPPQAFLYGAWTGGLFPPPSSVSAQECLAQPSVIFTRDVVMRATLTDVLYIQRAVETARGTGNGIDIHFVAAGPQASSGGIGIAPTDLGFGCDSVDVLHVQRLSPNEISFPGCRDFPFPLVRCPAG